MEPMTSFYERPKKTNKLIHPGYISRIKDHPDEIGKRAGPSQDWVEYYEVYPKIKDVVPPHLRTDKDLTALRKCRRANSEYVDHEFPRNLKPLVDPRGKLVHKDWDTLKWQSARTYFEGENFFVFNGISPEDIGQQAIGDCYLLGAISCLATQPGLVRRLFDIEEPNKWGVYCVWLNINGVWQQYVIDDYFPVNVQGAYVFTVPNKGQNEIWAMLLEKAYAKAYGGYYKIPSGILSEAFRDLTGAPAILYKLQEAKSNFRTREKIYKKIIKAFQTTYLVAAGTKPHPTIPEFKKLNGLIMGHAYSILDTDVLYRNGREIRLIQLRNPWGKDEWNGDWSDTSRLWTEEERAKLMVKEHECNDGIFWMCFDDFIQEFNELHICKVSPKFTYNSIPIKFKRRGRMFHTIIKINVNSSGKFTFSSDRKDRHFYREVITLLSLNRIILGKVIDDSEIKFMKADCDCFRNTYIRTNLTPGDYIALLEIEYSDKTMKALDQEVEEKFHNWRDVVFSSYGPTTCNLQQINESQYKNIDDQAFNKLQYHLLRDMFLKKPKDFHKYQAEKLGSNKFHVKMKSGKVEQINFTQYQLLDLMVVVLQNPHKRNFKFEHRIVQMTGYELVTADGESTVGDRSSFSIGPRGSEIFVLRFIDGTKEYLPDFL